MAFPFINAILLFMSCNFLSFFNSRVLLPAPPGPPNVYISTFALTDHSRVDPYAPHRTPRRIVCSVFYPGTCSNAVGTPYMPPKTAAFQDKALASYGINIPSGTFESFYLQSCPTPSKSSYPLVIFSPGLGESRLFYSLILQWISSLGFTVVSVDHPYDADIVEFPDGSVVYGGNISVPEDLSTALSVRVADVQFLVDALSSSSTLKSLSSEIASMHFETKHVAIFGHSFGGVTAAESLLVDERFVSGSNMDGSMYGRATKVSNEKPFVIFARPGHNQTTDATWETFWNNLRGWKLQLEVNGTAHGSFTDFPILARMLGLEPAKNPNIADLIGTIGGKRILTILQAYMGAFLKYTLEDKNSRLLYRPTKRFPEVSFQNSSFVC